MLDNKILGRHIISRRLFLLGAGKLFLLMILVIRLFFMQIIKRKQYQTLSDKNRISLIILQPNRGKIFDNSNKLLATNIDIFQLFLDKSLNKNYQQEITLIYQTLNLPQPTYEALIAKAKKASSRLPVLLINLLTWQQIAIIEELKPNLSALFIQQSHSRAYPFAAATVHIIGYTGLITEQDKLNLKLNNISDLNIGKTGIEKYYDQTLRGEFGYKHIEVNAYGRYIRELAVKPSVSGQSLYLNIDIETQEKANSYLTEPGSSVVVMDVTNGNIIVLASNPSYDPNNFVKLSQEYWQELTSDPYKPLINKAIQGNYPTGSVFKIVTILAALEAGIKTSKIVHCNGQSALNTNSFRCSSHQGHGALDMFCAIKYSCNSYMYEIAKIIGSNKILATAKILGFGKLTGIDLPSESKGFLPSQTWKEKTFNKRWTLGDTLNLAIGQGALLSTPLQLASLGAVIASGGKLYKPQIIRNSFSEAVDVNIKPEYLKIVKDAMYLAVNSQGGTAYGSRLKDFIIAGKTGTSQVQSKKNAYDDLSKSSVNWKNRNHGAFIGFGPFYNPRFAISVFVEHGGGGARAAAPIANKIFNDLFYKYL